MEDEKYQFRFRVQGNQRVKCYDPDDLNDCVGFYRVVPVDKTVIAVNEDHAMRSATMEMQEWYDQQGWDYELILWVVPVQVENIERVEVVKEEQLSLFDFL
jgi:hypothetical protein